MGNQTDQCSKGYKKLDGQCVPIMSQFRAPHYESIFGVPPPPDPPVPRLLAAA